MHNETLEKLTIAAKNKVNLLNSSRLKYIVSSAFAGLYVGIGILLIFTIGGLLTSANSPMTKIMMGVSFAIALSLVVMTGSELFTGNNMVMTAGTLNKGTSNKDLLRVWAYSFVGNLLGSLLVAGLFVGTGLVNKGAVMEFFATTSLAKASLPFMDLFFRGVLCNILVCVAVMCSFRTNDDTAKLIIIFMCLFAFITSGFEHSVANMTIFGVALFSSAIKGATLMGAIYNLFVVTLGNIAGGALVMGAGAYILGKKD
ncbi:MULTISPECIES: formate/nitrite transporter family protein [Clostridia]|uniref:formate/nitrite transporter family protein n=1 Tax=Clostridia TaxID=186801 RepID=UPI0004053FF8|nr:MULTISPECIES: formate/nitrite transporter family protein [Clostridiaceae]MCU9809412.1 formate/nitrite transporter family protein [Paraclostridium sp. AKS46]MBZ6006325.1 formate/nitrite transporter family protein [Paraclostridium bifermentans]MCE9676460.1 formate/nitrite transporter family protein [Paraclostridium bifermentans]MDT7918774.1 formate/nitrite transporter family protein [Clostridium perfringens]MDU0296707.1 formate/nitrite transporter family protein [Paraclostridium sp. MRS3W1]